MGAHESDTYLTTNSATEDHMAMAAEQVRAASASAEEASEMLQMLGLEKM